MGYIERTTWAQVVASIVFGGVYVAVVAPQLTTRPLERIDWIAPMLWSIAGGIVGSIVLSIVWGIVVGLRDGSDASASDQRDREIGWLGDRVGQAFLVLGGLAALILVMLDGPRFWIGNVIYAGFLLSAVVGGIARIVVYRRGF